MIVEPVVKAVVQCVVQCTVAINDGEPGPSPGNILLVDADAANLIDDDAALIEEPT